MGAEIEPVQKDVTKPPRPAPIPGELAKRRSGPRLQPNPDGALLTSSASGKWNFPGAAGRIIGLVVGPV